ncbi:MAG: hypothetical protein K2X66_05825 [Cyanobacteria bacterium]|nr:hypothetical protein [Cyanobacteriota bacterium]
MNRFDPSEECLRFQDIVEKNLENNSAIHPPTPSNVTPFLSHLESQLLSSHPSVCDACRNYQVNYQMMLKHLKSAPAPALSDDFTQQLMDKLEKEQGMEALPTAQSVINASNVVPFPHAKLPPQNKPLSNELLTETSPTPSNWKIVVLAWVATFLILAVSTVALLQKDFQYNPVTSSPEIASVPGSTSQSNTLGMPSAYDSSETTASPSNDSKIPSTGKALPKANTSITSGAKNRKGELSPANVPPNGTGSVEIAPVDRLIAMADDDTISNTALPGESTVSRSETSSPDFMTHYVGF